MRTVTQSMEQTVKGMDAALKNMDLDKIGAVMENFESQFEDLDVVPGYYEGVAGGVESQQVGVQGQDEVDGLINELPMRPASSCHRKCSNRCRRKICRSLTRRRRRKGWVIG